MSNLSSNNDKKKRVSKNALDAEYLVLSEPTTEDITYSHPAFILCGLPLRHRKGRREWLSEHGDVSLHIQSGVVAEGLERRMVNTEIPSGSAARIGFSHIHNHAIRASSLDEACNVDLGDSFRNYCDKYRIPVGGKNSKSISREIVNIGQAKMTIGLFGNEGRARTINVPQVADKVDFWIERDERQATIWNPSLTINPQYAETVRERGVPEDMRALIGLYENTGAMDVYKWLSYRCPRITDPKGVFIPYFGKNGLHKSFGRSIASPRKFKQAFLGWLKEAIKFYPDANVRTEDRGIRLFYSKAPVPPEVSQSKSMFFDKKLIKKIENKKSLESKEEKDESVTIDDEIPY